MDDQSPIGDSRSEIAALGGNARAKKLTPEERKEIAQTAALARWSGGDLPSVLCDGELIIAGRRIACAVLSTHKRVLTQQTFLTALGRTARPKGGTGTRRLAAGTQGLPPFLSAANLEPFISSELRESTTPIVYHTKKGGKAFGYDALLLPLVCEVYLKARDAHLEAVEAKNPPQGILQHMQVDLVKSADMFMRGLARDGIIALVDQATGFQEQRDRDALIKILEAYIAPELMPWTRRFDTEFFKQVYRIHGWPFKPGSTKRPQCVGTFINDYIYKQLPPGVLDELRRKNPVTESGYRRYKHTQFMADTGNEHLDRQITATTTNMRIADTKPEFKGLFDKAYPKLQLEESRPPLVIDVKPPTHQPSLFPDLPDSTA